MKPKCDAVVSYIGGSSRVDGEIAYLRNLLAEHALGAHEDGILLLVRLLVLVDRLSTSRIRRGEGKEQTASIRVVI